MDKLIIDFITAYFTYDLQVEIYRSFRLLNDYEYNDAFAGFVDIINNESYVSAEDMKDQFIIELNSKLNFILKEHTIELTNEATIFDKNEILVAFLLIQDLEDYTGIISLLESFESKEEKLSLILSDLTMLDQAKVLELVVSFSDTMLDTLKQFIYEIENNKPEKANGSKFITINNLKQLFSCLGKDNLGYLLAKSGVIVGERFETYLPYTDKDLVANTDEQTALNILSLIYMSSDGINNPLLLYRKYSFQILQDLNKVSRIEVLVVSMVNKLNEFKKALHEKDRLSQTSAAQ